MGCRTCCSISIDTHYCIIPCICSCTCCEILSTLDTTSSGRPSRLSRRSRWTWYAALSRYQHRRPTGYPTLELRWHPAHTYRKGSTYALRELREIIWSPHSSDSANPSTDHKPVRGLRNESSRKHYTGTTKHLQCPSRYYSSSST